MLYIIAQIGFVALTVIFFYLLYRVFTNALPQTSLTTAQQKNFKTLLISVLLFWAVAVSAFSISGTFGNFEIFPLNAAPVLMIPLLSILFFTFSKTTKEILIQLHPGEIIKLQVFRLFVEVLLWLLFIQNLLPVQMTFEGRNFDVLSGLSAPVISYLAYQNKLPKWALILWNLACLGLLINIVSVAILSMPTPIQVFKNEPSNTIVTQFPISWLPAFLVPLAYMLHFLSIRQIFLKR